MPFFYISPTVEIFLFFKFLSFLAVLRRSRGSTGNGLLGWWLSTKARECVALGLRCLGYLGYPSSVRCPVSHTQLCWDYLQDCTNEDAQGTIQCSGIKTSPTWSAVLCLSQVLETFTIQHCSHSDQIHVYLKVGLGTIYRKCSKPILLHTQHWEN